MKRPSIPLTLHLAMIALLASAAAAAPSTYGKGVTIDRLTPISEILAKPQDFTGKTVAVKGLVVDVCASRGCWMELAGDKSYEKLRVKVEDGVIVFPLSARGRQATVQGTLEVIRMCPDEALRHRQKEAREQGASFDPSSVTSQESYLTLRVTGAVVE